jgi:hypothetical protein
LTKETNIPQDGTWAIYQYIDNADRYITLDTPYVAPEEVDESALKTAITQGDAVNKPIYTTATLIPFNEALNNAHTVIQDEDATQNSVDAATTTLTNAINGQLKDPDVVNKDALKAALTTAQKYVDAGQVSTSLLQDLQTYIAAGRSSIDNLSTPQTRVDAQTTKLHELIAQAEREAPITVDKSVLTQAITTAKSTLANASDYTSTTSKVAQDALSAAEQLLADDDATQDRVDSTTMTLDSAITGLVKATDKTNLITELQNAQNAIKATDKYTEDSVAQVSSAITVGKNIDLAAGATQTQINVATATLKSAVAGLVKAPVKAVVDKSVLSSELQTAKTAITNASQYTGTSVKAVDEAITAGTNTNATTDATQAEVNAAVDSLKSAVTGLIKAPTTTPVIGNNTTKPINNNGNSTTKPSISTTTKSNQGPAINYSKYVTVTKKGYTVWGNFNWNKKMTNTTSLFGKIYLARVKYNHSNGATYLSLYDGSKWLGYINADATKVSAKQQGNAISANKYVTLTSKNYTIWNGFDFKKVKHYSKNYYQKTYHVKTIYNHASGAVYYSLYDSKGKWFGYINATATKTASGAQGIAISTNKYVTLTSKNYTIWSGFDFKKVKHYSKNYYNKTYQVKTVYNHASGAVYYSLYDNNGKWFGYINASGTKQASGAQGIAITYNKTVTVKKSGYTIWGDFFTKKRGTTTDYVGKRLTAKVAYNHINGSQYLSLYSGSKWIGYVNVSVIK